MDMTKDPYTRAKSLEEAAAERGLAVHTSEFFSVMGPVPGLEVDTEFTRAAFALDPDDENRSFSDAIVAEGAVFVVATQERQEEHVPEFAAITNEVMPVATRMAERDAFLAGASKAREAILAAVTDGQAFSNAAVTAGMNVSTSMVFSFTTAAPDTFQEARSVIPEIITMQRGEVSDVIQVPGGVVVAHVEERVPGDPMYMQLLRPDLLQSMDRLSARASYPDWMDFLLERARAQTADELPPPSVGEEEEPAL
jgi:hypothetical protein